MARGASAYERLPTLYLPEEVAAHLRVSIRTVKRFIASGRLKVMRFGRAPRITEEDLEDFLREGTCGIKATVRAASSSSGALRTASGTSAGTTPPLDRPIAFRLAQQTAKRRARRSTNMP
ncbi:MAG: helix-turn-helix domain-containing protein [Gammaproteobacteria bacterium]|nr:MAG: helix-turn-helix domain-containing protein [Gammaproteobacteria bacterium]